MISLSVEWRWGTAKYKGMTFDESEFDEDSMGDDSSVGDILQNAPDRKFKTNSLRGISRIQVLEMGIMLRKALPPIILFEQGLYQLIGALFF